MLFRSYKPSGEFTNTPLGPDNLTAEAISFNEIQLEWTDNSDNEFYFILERKINENAFQVIDTIAANITSYNDVGLGASETKYTYRIAAVNPVGKSDYSNEASDITNLSPPAPPYNLQIEALNCKMEITWDDSSTVEEGFVLERQIQFQTSFSEIAKT